MKKVLVLYYTQSGQLLDIAKNIASDLEKNDEIELTYYAIKTKHQFPFPWTKKEFFNIFPETFLQKPFEIDFHTPEKLNQKYDLVILAYQVWYLTPSIPINSFLKTDIAKKLLEDTPVITTIGCRNMWIMAQEKVKKLLLACKANLVGNIVLTDRHINHISVITITHWMFSGKKTRYLGIFPKPGVSENDIKNATKFSLPILKSLQASNYDNLQNNLLKLRAVAIKPFLVLTDKRANLLFSKWANFIIKKGKLSDPKRLKWTNLFNKYLLFAIWLIAPIVFIVFLLTYIPLLKKIKSDKKYYQSVSYKEN